MDFSANHIGFVIGSYALSAIFLFGLTIAVVARDRRLRAEAEMLERQRRQKDGR
jgi:heme exporter protein CcmD